MKATIKSMLMLVLAFGMICSFTKVNAATSYAKNKVYINPSNYESVTKERVSVNSLKSFNVYMIDAGDYVKITSYNKKKMDAAVTYEYDNYARSTSDSGTYIYDCYATISYLAKQKGTYKIKFTVYKANGTKRGSYTYTAYAVDSTDTITSIKLGNTTIKSISSKSKNGTVSTKTYYNSKVASNVKGGKLKVTMNAGYKVTGLVIATNDSNCLVHYKKVKNGANISLSTGLAEVSKSSTGFSKSVEKCTSVYVSYKDTFTNTSCTYSVVSGKGVKRVTKVGKKVESVSFWPSSTFSIYQ